MDPWSSLQQPYARSGTTSAIEEGPLTIIRAAQDGQLPGYPSYTGALREIQNGAKRSCWMWYIWPSLQTVRKHSRPNMLLRTFHGDCMDYKQDKVLWTRLQEITVIATAALQAGVAPVELLGTTVDSLKFHQAVTLFAVVALAGNRADERAARIFVQACRAYSNSWNETVVQVLRNNPNNDNDQHLHQSNGGCMGDACLNVHIERVQVMILLDDDDGSRSNNTAGKKKRQWRLARGRMT